MQANEQEAEEEEQESVEKLEKRSMLNVLGQSSDIHLDGISASCANTQ
jgi:hypothetical protein